MGISLPTPSHSTPTHSLLWLTQQLKDATLRKKFYKLDTVTCADPDAKGSLKKLTDFEPKNCNSTTTVTTPIDTTTPADTTESSTTESSTTTTDHTASTSTATTAPSTPKTTSSPSGGRQPAFLSTTAVISLSIGGVVALAFLVALGVAVVCRRRRHGEQMLGGGGDDDSRQSLVNEADVGEKRGCLEMLRRGGGGGGVGNRAAHSDERHQGERSYTTANIPA